MRPLESVRKVEPDQISYPTLSPVGDSARPESLFFEDVSSYRQLFMGALGRRAPLEVSRKGLLDRFFRRSSALKMEADVSRGFDVSVALCPIGLKLQGWGVAVDCVGRVFEVTSDQDARVELIYQGGALTSPQDWLNHMEKSDDKAVERVRTFCVGLRRLAGDRIHLAATVGFGLWDALWMSFDFDRAIGLLTRDPGFVEKVFQRWSSYHVAVIGAMMDAGIDMVLFREHPAGFPRGSGVAALLDGWLRDCYRQITDAAKARGGFVALDCDADDMIETNLPVEWGFSGVGPLLFRDEKDIIDARKALSEELFLIGSLAYPQGTPIRHYQSGRRQGIMLAGKPKRL